MRKAYTVVAIGLFSTAVAAQSDQPPTATPAEVGAVATPGAQPSEGPEAVEVRGELPASLAGAWLMIQSPQVKTQYTNMWTVYTIEKVDSTWRMRQLEGKAAPALDKAIKGANAAGKRFQPDEKVLAEALGMVPHLKSPPASERDKRYIFVDPAHFPADRRDSPQLKKSKLSLGVMGSSPTASTSGFNYFFTDLQHDLISGTFEVGMVAIHDGAPPVPIGFVGEFVMYRLK